jgi:hypothetical protein
MLSSDGSTGMSTKCERAAYAMSDAMPCACSSALTWSTDA